MEDIKKLLLATDLYETSEDAFEMTKFLKRKLGSEVSILHVVSEQEDLDDVSSERKEALEKLCEELGQECRYQVVQGNPTNEILKFIENEKAGLLVMGTSHSRGLSRLVNDSVARQVRIRTGRPILEC